MRMWRTLVVSALLMNAAIRLAAEEVPMWKVQVIGGNGAVVEEVGAYYSYDDATEAEQRWIKQHPDSLKLTRIVEGKGPKPEQRLTTRRPQPTEESGLREKKSAGVELGPKKPVVGVELAPKLDGKLGEGTAGKYQVQLEFVEGNKFAFTSGLSGNGTWEASDSGAVVLSTKLSSFRGTVSGDKLSGLWFRKDGSVPPQEFVFKLQDRAGGDSSLGNKSPEPEFSLAGVVTRPNAGIWTAYHQDGTWTEYFNGRTKNRWGKWEQKGSEYRTMEQSPFNGPPKWSDWRSVESVKSTMKSRE